MKVGKKEIVSACVSVVPILLLAVFVIVPTLELLTAPISDETGKLLSQLVESYLIDMDIDGEYLLVIMLSWILLVMIGVYLSLMYVGHFTARLCDIVWEKLTKWE